MFRDKILAVLCAFLSLQLMGILAYPMLNIPYLFVPETRYKKNDLGFPVARLADEEIPIDGDVMELEHLKHAPVDTLDILETITTDKNNHQQQGSTIETDVKKQGHTIVSPELLHGSDAETVVTLPPPISTTPRTTTTPTSKQVSGEILGGGVHHPPVLSHNDHKSGQQQTAAVQTEGVAEVNLGVPSVAKTAKSLLHHQDGQYSSFDMAQYIFWTGDEAGVAQAIEECVENGLMSRETALKFLRDIRLGIEYLQHSFENRVFPEAISQNNIKKSYALPINMISKTTTTTTTENPLPQSGKTLDSIGLWNKLQELNNDARQDLNEYDEAAGRAKIAEFLYTHYTVEEILYKLAKVMFTQSLAQGSDEAQRELQKLTDFLEREGNMGVIPIDLQKKVLHVLLTALSDTLSEHPELLTAARQNLINPYERVPVRTYAAVN